MDNRFNIVSEIPRDGIWGFIQWHWDKNSYFTKFKLKEAVTQQPAKMLQTQHLQCQ